MQKRCKKQKNSHLTVAILAMSIYPMSDQFRQEANKLFSDLTRHYASKFEDPSMRIGNLMLFLEMIEVTFKLEPNYSKCLGYQTDQSRSRYYN